MLVLQLDGDPEDANDVTVIDGGIVSFVEAGLQVLGIERGL
jgi:hypothetical protein